jgi:phosphatidylserine/phosphatidylglycerophosphate/cardiolipin synthase-like enzyme
MGKTSKEKVNLNKRIDDDTRKKQSKVDAVGKIVVHFDGSSIEAAICRRIRRQDVKFVVGAVAWLTNEKILNTLATYARGVAIITTHDKTVRAESNKRKYRKLSCFNDAVSPIQTINSGGSSKWQRALMHHKFLVYLDVNQDAIAVSTGSANLTASSVRHLENCMFIEDRAVARIFLNEFLRLYAISKPLKL